MKPPSDSLHSLIHALSPNEKRYIALRYSNEVESNYVTLYSIIEQQEVYNETEVLERIAERHGSVRLPMLKKYLEQSLIGILCDYHGASGSSWQQARILFVGKILRNKGLNKMTGRLLRQVRSAAEKDTNALTLLAANNIEVSFVNDIYGLDSSAIQDALYTEAQQAIKILAADVEYVHLQSTAQRLMREAHEGQEGRALRELLAHPFMQDGSPITFKQRITYTSIRSRIHVLLGETDLAFHYAQMNIDAWESSPSFRDEHAVSYAGALTNYYSRALQATRYDVLDDIHARLQQLSDESHELRLCKFQVLTQLDNVLALLKGAFHDSTERLISFEARLAEYERYTNHYIVRSIRAGFAYVFLLSGNWSDAHKQIAATLLDTHALDHVVTSMRVIQYAALFELQLFDLIESSYRSAKRSSRTKSKMSDHEKRMLDLVRTFMMARSSDDVRALAMAELQSANPLHKELTKSDAMLSYVLRCWLLSHALGTPIAKVSVAESPGRQL